MTLDYDVVGETVTGLCRFQMLKGFDWKRSAVFSVGLGTAASVLRRFLRR